MRPQTSTTNRLCGNARLAIAMRANAADGSILPAVRGVLNGRGDLDPDEGGVCRRISGAFDFGGVSAFLY